MNGARYPQARTARGWIRLRLLNGSNARSYTLTASDGRSLYVIGSDGGLLESPVELKQLLIHVGERFEVVVDGRDGRAFDIVTLPVAQDIMRLPPFDGPLPLVTISPTVSEYIIRRGHPPSQSWRTFLRNHAAAIAAIDLCLVPTVHFERLFAFSLSATDGDSCCGSR